MLIFTSIYLTCPVISSAITAIHLDIAGDIVHNIIDDKPTTINPAILQPEYGEHFADRGLHDYYDEHQNVAG